MPAKPAKRQPRLSPHEMEQRVEQLVQRFYADVAAGQYQVGDTLPSLREFEELYDAPYTVARKFYEHLKQAGLIVTVERKGTILANPTAAALPSTRLKKRGIVVAGVMHWEHPGAMFNANSLALRGIEDECLKTGIPMRFHNLCDSVPGCSRSCDGVLPERVRALAELDVAGGIVLASAETSGQSDALLELGMPLVSVGVAAPGITAVVADHVAMGRKAARHLLELGHRKITTFAYRIEDEWMSERLTGIQAALAEHGIPESERPVVWLPLDAADQEGRICEAMLPLLPEIHRSSTAAQCVTDIVGKIILDYENREYLPRGQRLALVTFDDDAQFRSYDMTAIRRATGVQAAVALQELLKLIVSPATQGPAEIPVAGNLYVRSTSIALEDRIPR